jgi:hypothetical protein
MNQLIVRTCVYLTFSLLAQGQVSNSKRYDSKNFRFSYPSNWGLQELADGDVVIGDPDEHNPLKTLEISTIPGALSQEQALQAINRQLSGFAAANHFKLKYKESGRTGDNRVEVQSSLLSAKENMDVLTSVSLQTGQLIQFMFEPGKFKEAYASAQSILNTVEWGQNAAPQPAQRARDPYLGTWQREVKDSTGETKITLELRADGTYTKTLDAFLRGRAFHGSETGTWTADGPVVQCSGDGNSPASTHNLQYYQKISK